MSRAALPNPEQEKRRLRAMEVRTDLIILHKYRRATGQKIDLFWWGFCMARVILMFPGGRYRYWPEFKGGPRKGQRMTGEYWATWPEATADYMLGEVSGDFDAADHAAVTRGIDAAKACHGASFLKADTIGKKLGVTIVERDNLGIYTIGAYDMLRAARLERRAETKKARDRERSEAKRRANGAKPREEWLAQSIAAQAQAMRITPAALRKRLSRARKSGFEVTSASPVLAAHVTGASPPLTIDSHLGDGPVTPPSMVAGAPPISGARPPAQRESSGKTLGRNCASAVGRNMKPAGRKRVAHPTIAGAARPSAALEAATGPSAPLTCSPANPDSAPRQLHRAPPQSGARHQDGGQHHAHARGPDMAKRSPAAARRSFLCGFPLWAGVSRKRDAGPNSATPAAALAPGGQFVRLGDTTLRTETIEARP
jgi:hypothetical protein